MVIHPWDVIGLFFLFIYMCLFPNNCSLIIYKLALKFLCFFQFWSFCVSLFLCIRRKPKLYHLIWLHYFSNWMEIWSTLLRNFTFQSFFDTQHILFSVSEFSLWVLQGREPKNVWFTVELMADRGSHTVQLRIL
jgi:hypothetical protein